MIEIESSLSGRMIDYVSFRDVLERHGFMLGGNWEYRHGSFDRRLDGDAQTVWLRIPFEAVQGEIDPHAPPPGTRVVVGTPYVLRHLYNTVDDHTAHFYTAGALVNQFQSPTDPDAKVDAPCVEEARDVLREVETAFG